MRNADQILVLDQGKINGLGTHQELLRTNAIYREMARSQNLLEKEEKAHG